MIQKVAMTVASQSLRQAVAPTLIFLLLRSQEWKGYFEALEINTHDVKAYSHRYTKLN